MLISRFLPFSVLLGTLIAFAGLNQHSEVVSMKAAGISAHQILAPLIVASLGVALALFAFNERVVVKSAAHGDRLERRRLSADPADRAGSCPTSGSAMATTWSAPGSSPAAEPRPALQDVTIYEREGGALARVIDVERADPGARRLAA